MTRLRFLLVLVCALAPGLACSDPLPLWELKGTNNRIMFLGSIHMLRNEDYPLAKGINQAYRDADTLIMEIDMDDIDPTQTQITVMKLAAAPDGKQLKDLLGASAYAEAREKLEAIGIGMSVLDPFEPWYAAIVVTQLRLMQLGFDPGSGVDARLAARATQDGKDIRGLESLEYQLGLLDGMSAGAQRDFLITTLDEAENIESEVDDMITAWKNGDTQALEILMLKSVEKQPELYKRLLIDRNRNWAKAISELTDDSENYLIVVGMLHLIGKDSVLVMLDHAGYPSQQVLH